MEVLITNIFLFTPSTSCCFNAFFFIHRGNSSSLPSLTGNSPFLCSLAALPSINGNSSLIQCGLFFSLLPSLILSIFFPSSFTNWGISLLSLGECTSSLLSSRVLFLHPVTSAPHFLNAKVASFFTCGIFLCLLLLLPLLSPPPSSSASYSSSSSSSSSPSSCFRQHTHTHTFFTRKKSSSRLAGSHRSMWPIHRQVRAVSEVCFPVSLTKSLPSI